jgi:hypothetical protein
MAMFSKAFRKLTHKGNTVHATEKHFSLSCMDVAFRFGDDIVFEVRKYVKETLGIELSEVVAVSGIWINFLSDPQSIVGRSYDCLQIIQRPSGEYVGIVFFATIKRVS